MYYEWNMSEEKRNETHASTLRKTNNTGNETACTLVRDLTV